MNTLLPFSFANLPVRGRLLQLQGLTQHVPSFNQANQACAQTLAELLAAAALIAHDAKHTLAVSLQIQHPALGVLVFAHSSNRGSLKAYANAAAQVTPFSQLSKVEGGIFAVTMEPENLENRYQSLIPLTKPSAAESLADYFATSVQTATYFVVFANAQRAFALMLQSLPHEKTNEDDWTRLGLLSKTLSAEEVLAEDLNPQSLLEKLFAEDDLTLYPAENPTFVQEDPRPRMLAALSSLPRAELTELMSQGTVTLTDNTTGQTITFTPEELAHLADDTGTQ
ncbi:MAG: hypothetical protein GC129_04510 [Proteobacteria bacterium]|nr:hypothetical protein [Pseudomonadota bacterium]